MARRSAAKVLQCAMDTDFGTLVNHFQQTVVPTDDFYVWNSRWGGSDTGIFHRISYCFAFYLGFHTCKQQPVTQLTCSVFWPHGRIKGYLTYVDMPPCLSRYEGGWRSSRPVFGRYLALVSCHSQVISWKVLGDLVYVYILFRTSVLSKQDMSGYKCTNFLQHLPVLSHSMCWRVPEHTRKLCRSSSMPICLEDLWEIKDESTYTWVNLLQQCLSSLHFAAFEGKDETAVSMVSILPFVAGVVFQDTLVKASSKSFW